MSIFDAPNLSDSEEKITYSIWVGDYGKRLKEIKWSDSWSVIQHYWDTVKNKLKKSSPIKDGYVIAELRFWRTNSFCYERRSNRKGYLLRIFRHYTNSPNLMAIDNQIMEVFVTKHKIAIHYAEKFKRMGNKVEVFKCNSAKTNSWVKVLTLEPFIKQQSGSLIIREQTALVLIPSRNYTPNF